MALSTITVLQPDLGSMNDVTATLYDAIGSVDTITGQTATGFTGYTDGLAIDFAGSGLTYDGKTGAVTGGTLTGFTLRNADGRLFVVSLSTGINAKTLLAADAGKVADIFAGYADLFVGHDDGEIFKGGKFDDLLLGSTGADTLSGGAGNDLIEGGPGGDVLDGGDGNADTVNYGNAEAGITVFMAQTSVQPLLDGDKIAKFENLIGTNFDDLVFGTDDANVIEGGAGRDQIIAAGGNDKVLAGGGNDIINADLGADTLDGGDGEDDLLYSSDKNMTLTLGKGGAQVTVVAGAGSDAAGDKIANIENIFAGSGNDKITGNELANTIHGGGGSDILKGGDGNDTLEGGDNDDIVEGGAGNDRMEGNDGIDTVSYASSPDGVTIDPFLVFQKGGHAEGDNITSGFEILIGSAKNDSVTVVLGGGNNITTIDGRAGDDILSGVLASSDDTLTGGLGNDTIFGGAGNDTIEGGLGDDVVEGGEGADVLKGNTGLDTLSYAGETDSVTVALMGAAAVDLKDNTGNDAEGDVATGFENLRGGTGKDVLTGDKGNNVIEGGAEADELEGGAGIDTVSFAHSAQAVQVALFLGFGFGGDANDDKITGFENIIGSANGDFLQGTDSANKIEAGAGNDTVAPDLGADRYDGGDGVDLIDYENLKSNQAVTVTLGAPGVQTAVVAPAGSMAAGDKIKNFENVIGGAGNDVLNGNALDNKIEGRDGDDTISGGAGKDVLDGGNDGAKGDTLSYASQKGGITVGGVTVDLNLGIGVAQVAQVSDASGDKLGGFENLVGTSKGDILRGTSDTNVISGGAGDDIVEGRGMNGLDIFETLDGGAGKDTASYESSTAGVTVDLSLQGSKTLQAGGDAGNDKLAGFENLIGSTKADVLSGDKGSNTIEGRAGADAMHGGAGNDTLSYAGSASGVAVALQDDGTFLTAGGDAAGDTGDGFENIIGSAKNDALEGNKFANVLNGGDGDDAVVGHGGKDLLLGGDGNDQVFGGADSETLDGGGGNDLLDGDKGADVMRGGAGNDELLGAMGADTMDGGADVDTLTYKDAGAGESITVVLGETNKQTMVVAMTGSMAAGDKIVNFENVNGSGDARFVLTGNSASNLLQGGDGNDILKGLAGDDKLSGGKGDDVIEGGKDSDNLDGGDGTNDTLSYASSAEGVIVSLIVNGAALGDAQGDTIKNFENVIGSGKDDDLFGSATLNTIAGGAGNDSIRGLGAADTLDGGTGFDTADYADSAIGVTVDLSLQASKTAQMSVGDAKGDILTGFEAIVGSFQDDKLTGDGGNNTIDGGVGNDVIDGGKGNDTLFGSFDKDSITGGDGNDVIEGGPDADKMSGGNGIDTLSYAGDVTGVFVALGGAGSFGDAAGDQNSGFENLIGGSNGDVLFGDDLANMISGGDGNDTIQGGKGADVLDGGNGRDNLQYVNTLAGETITLTFGEANVQTTVTATAGSQAAGDKLKNFEDFGGGGPAKYVVTGNSFGNAIETNSGNDVIKGLGGDDALDGGDGDDLIEGGLGNDELTGGSNTGIGDTLSYKASSAGVSIDLDLETADGGDATGDTITGFEHIVGSDKDDVLSGNANINKIDGGGGNDTIKGGAAQDILVGGTGTNTLSYSGGATGVTVTLVAGKQATVSSGDADGDIATQFQNLIGTKAIDKLTGDTGNNVIEGGGGADILEGGKGIDTLSYEHNSSVGVFVILGISVGGSALTSNGDSEGDFATGFENVTGSALDDTLIGDDKTNVLRGLAGNDRLGSSDSGNPIDGNDTLDGGDGSDTAVFSPGTTVNLAAGTATRPSVMVTLRSIENVAGGIGDDVFNALGFSAASTNAGSVGLGNWLGDFNEFEGRGGNDTILGNGRTQINYQNADAAVSVDLMAGIAQSAAPAKDAQIGIDTIVGGVNSIVGSTFNDFLIGSDNLDEENFEGGEGDDSIDGNGGFDRAVYSNTLADGISVDLGNGTVTPIGTATSGADSLLQVEAIRGTQGNDIFDASTFSGSSANAGDLGKLNEFEGGLGADTIVGNGETRIAFYHAQFGVTVDLATGKATGSDIGTDTISGVNSVRGSDFNDSLRGDGGVNVLDGRLGDDTLEGTGGADTFVYSVGLKGDFVGGGQDTILDYAAGADTIDLRVDGMLNYADVRSKMSQVGSDVVIDFGDGDTLTIKNVTLGTLDNNSGDFLFS